MSCNCDMFSIEKVGTDTAAAVKLELGPAYQDYMQGNIEISKSWNREYHIPSWILPACCSEEEFDAFGWETEWHLSSFILWIIACCVLVYAILTHGHLQPLRHREKSVMIAFIVNLSSLYLLNVINLSSNLAGKVTLQLVALMVNVPIHFGYYIFQVWCFYVSYNSSFYLSSSDTIKAKKFSFMRRFLGSKTFFICIAVIGCFGTACVLCVTYLIPEYNAFNLYDSLRCSWWDIPPQYTNAQNSSSISMCSCINAVWYAGDVETECTQSFTDTCFSGETSPYYDFSAFCEECGGQTPQCDAEFTAIMTSGVCGYPKTMPDFGTCSSGIGTNPEVQLFYVCLTLAILGVLGLSSFFVLRMQDNLLLNMEIALMEFIGVPIFILVYICLLSSKANNYLQQSVSGYPFPFIFLHIGCWYCLVISVVVPVVATFVWNKDTHRKYTMTVDDEVIYADKDALDTNSTEPGMKDSQLFERPSSVLKMRKNLAVSSHIIASRSGNDIIAMELAFAIDNVDAGLFYLDFSWREFSAESFLFLKAVEEAYVLSQKFYSMRQTSPSGTRKISITDPEDVDVDFSTYIAYIFDNQGSDFEVNLPNKIRKQVTNDTNELLKKLEDQKMHIMGDLDLDYHGFTSPLLLLNEAADSEIELSSKKTVKQNVYNSLPEQKVKEDILAAMNPAVNEIVHLVIMDSWPRFRNCCECYVNFRHLFEKEAKKHMSV